MSKCISFHGEYSDHEFTPEQGEFICARCDVLDEDAALDEVERLRQWKAEALPVIAGLQELGRTLGMPLGARITGTEAAERARELARERDAVVEAVLELHRRGHPIAGPEDMCLHCRDEFGAMVEWPCPTVEAINGALGAVQS